MNEWMSSFRQSKSQEKWKAIARWEVGTSHEATKTPCQDYAGYKQYGDYCIGVVADGAGSRRYSEYGSTVAVDVALRYFIEILEGLRGKSLFTSQNDAEDIFHKLIDQVRAELGTKAGNFSREYKEKISADQFACTLLVFVVFPEGIAAMQLGDGFIVVRDYKSQEYDLLFSPSKGEYVNETTFVTSSPKDIAQDLQIIYLPNSISFICASTDGLEKVALDLATNKAFSRFFIPLEKYIQNALDLDKDSYITDFLKSEQVNRKTDDDKTILLCSSIKADPAPEINIVIPDSKTPTILPSTSTPPPSIENSDSKTNKLPSGRRAIRNVSNKLQAIPEKKDDLDIETKTLFQQPINTKQQEYLDRITRFFRISSFLMVYFVLLSSLLIMDKYRDNIYILSISLVVAIVISLYTILAGLDISEINDKNVHAKKYGVTNNEMISVVLPLIAIALAYSTSILLTNSTRPTELKSSTPTTTPTPTPTPTRSFTPTPKPTPTTQ